MFTMSYRVEVNNTHSAYFDNKEAAMAMRDVMQATNNIAIYEGTYVPSGNCFDTKEEQVIVDYDYYNLP